MSQDLPQSPGGQNYSGMPVVDGRVVARPFAEALRTGVVDVPLVMSNMAFEVRDTAFLTH
jgi:alpha-D-ribose 1-methylphosphonate 5-triphosphate synthase subunit PhnI